MEYQANKWDWPTNIDTIVRFNLVRRYKGLSSSPISHKFLWDMGDHTYTSQKKSDADPARDNAIF